MSKKSTTIATAVAVAAAVLIPVLALLAADANASQPISHQNANDNTEQVRFKLK